MTASTTRLEAQRQAAAITALTGEWWCQHGQHATKGKRLRYRGRSICERCKAVATAGNRKRSKA